MHSLKLFLAALVAAVAVVCPAHAMVSSTTTLTTASCDGVLTAYTIGFPFQKVSDIRARVYTGSTLTTTLNYTTDFTVTPSSSSGTGTLTLVAAGRCANGKTLKIDRNLPLTQTTPLRTQGNYAAATHEALFDRIVMMLQQINAGTASPPTSTVTTSAPITGDGSVGNAVTCQVASASQPGCISSTDWSTFNNKAGLSSNTFTGTQTITVGSGDAAAIVATGHGAASDIQANSLDSRSATVLYLGINGAGTHNATNIQAYPLLQTIQGIQLYHTGAFIDTDNASAFTLGPTNATGVNVVPTLRANTLDARTATTLAIGPANATGVTITPATTITGNLTGTSSVLSNAMDARTATTLVIGGTNATAVTITPATTVTGAITASSTKNKGTCVLNAGTPATCTATVTSGATCVVSPNGTTAAIAARALAWSVTTTTLTITGPNGDGDTASYLCF